MQVNLKHKPEIGLMEENNCGFAGIQSKRDDLGKNSCIFAGILAKERRGRHWLSHWNGFGRPIGMAAG